MKQEREEELKKRRAEDQKRLQGEQERRAKLEAVRKDLFGLFKEQNRHKRGKALEGVLNRLFQAAAISVREAFTLTGEEGEGIVEQVDGVVEIDGELYFVEMKWWKDPIGVAEISEHLVRVFS